MSRLMVAPLVALLCVALATPAARAQTTLHLYGYDGDPVNAIIDWGSDPANATCPRIIQGAGQSVTCELTGSGDRIRVSGTVPQFGPGSLSETGNTVSRVVSWGNVGLRSLDGAFKGNPSLTAVPVTVPETVENLNSTFKDASAFSQNLASWGMSVKNVVTMTDLFDGALAQMTDMSRWCMKNFEETPPGFLGRSQGRAPALINFSSRSPRMRECGLTLPGGLPATAEAESFFSFSLRSGLEVWSNAPAQTDLTLMTFDVVGGELPPGLTLDGVTGQISGFPTTPGEYVFQIRARQSQGD